MEGADFDVGGMDMGDVDVDMDVDVDVEVDVEVDGVDEVYDVEEAENEEETGGMEVKRPKFKRPKNAPQVPQKRKIIPVKVRSYACCSLLTVTFCNILFLGTAAMKCSLKARQRRYRKDIAGARCFGRYALISNTLAVTLTVIIITLAILLMQINAHNMYQRYGY